MANEDERRLILEMIESGKITAEEGLSLLQALPADDAEAGEEELLDAWAAPAEPISAEGDSAAGASTAAHAVAEVPEVLTGTAAQASKPPDFERWRRFWMVPLWVGIGVMVLGALFMVWAQRSSGIGFWFFCAWVPFALGLLVIILAWQSRTARWLHLRVQQEEGEWPRNIAFSFPLPLRLGGWFLRTFRSYIPGMEAASIDEMLSVIEKSTDPENPLYIEVEEGEHGERVQIYIG